MKALLLLPGALLVVTAAACGSSVAGTGGAGSGECADAEPGCDEPPAGTVALPQAGCYETCSQAGAACAGGGTCQKAWTNPCPCPDVTAGCCEACGGETLLCLP